MPGVFQSKHLTINTEYNLFKLLFHFFISECEQQDQGAVQREATDAIVLGYFGSLVWLIHIIHHPDGIFVQMEAKEDVIKIQHKQAASSGPQFPK